MAEIDDRDLMPPPPRRRNKRIEMDEPFVFPAVRVGPCSIALLPLIEEPEDSEQTVISPFKVPEVPPLKNRARSRSELFDSRELVSRSPNGEERGSLEHYPLYLQSGRESTPSPSLAEIFDISSTEGIDLESNGHQWPSEEGAETSSSGLDPDRDDDHVLIQEPANGQNSYAAPTEEGSSSSVVTPRYHMSAADNQFAAYWMKRATPEHLLPKAPAVAVESSSDLELYLLKNFCWKQDVAVIKDLVPTFNLDLAPFTSEFILRAAPHFFVQVRRQPLQPPTVNLDGMGKPTWRCRMTFMDSTLYDFVDYQVASFLESQKVKGLDNDEPQPSTSAAAAAAANTKNRKTVEYTPKLDLSDDRTWRSQLEQLDKLPPLFRINSEGNLLSHIGYKVPGVNTPQMCLMVAGSRVPAMQTDLNFCTVNLNIGPGDCEWFVVAYEHWKTLAALCGTKGIKYHHEAWWPDMEDLKNAGIPVYYFVQQPGQLVWLHSGAVHWYQALGICNNISWNVGPSMEFQMRVSMERYKWNRIEKIRSLVPMIHLTWNLARNLEEARYEREFFMSIKLNLLECLRDCGEVLELVKKENIPMITETMDGNGQVRYCTECSGELFNFYFRYTLELDEKNEKENDYCIKCAEKNRGSLGDFIGFQEHEMEELMQVFEGFTFRK